MTTSESPTHPDAPRADEARDDECGLLHPNGVFCDKPRGHVGSHAAYSDSPELCLSWGARLVDAPRAGGETPPSETHAPRTYQSAWAWDDSVDSDSPPPMMRTAEEWLREEAYVQRQMADGDDETPEDDDLPDRAGIMEAIAKEIDTIRRERTQWAEAFTKLRAEHDALRASLLERHRDGERWRALVAVLDLESMRTPEPGALIRMLSPHDAQSIAYANLLRALRAALPGMAELRAAATHYIAIHNRHDSVYIRENGRHGHSPWAELVDAARAAQPEETSHER